MNCSISKCRLFINKFKIPKLFAYLHRISKTFPLTNSTSFKVDGRVSLSNQLMLDYGLIFPQQNGLFTLLPLGLRALEKLTRIIDTQMKKSECQKIFLPHLTNASLLKVSGRYEDFGSEAFFLKDHSKQEYILSPTHEEAITSLVGSFKLLSHSKLPIRLYQISTKFRDEKRVKHGLLRSREFLMKDLYTFDKNLTEAKYTYDNISNIYCKIFSILDIPFKKVQASVGTIGGVESHEFHLLSDIGEDSLVSCNSCSYMANKELLDDQNINTCPLCSETLLLNNGIEVGHSFLLGTKYSTPMKAYYQGIDRNLPLYMGCFGIGITRLFAAGIEILSTENHIIWPEGLAPFKVCLIPPKAGSKENSASHWCYHLEQLINEVKGYEDEVIVDDRLKLSIGQRYNYAQSFGFPIIIIVGKQALNNIPMFELTHKNKKMTFNQSDLLQYLKDC